MTLYKILCIITKSQIIAAMAQEVERILGKDEVTSSTLVSSSKNPECESVRDFTFYFLPLHSYLKIKFFTGFLGSNKFGMASPMNMKIIIAISLIL